MLTLIILIVIAAIPFTISMLPLLSNNSRKENEEKSEYINSILPKLQNLQDSLGGRGRIACLYQDGSYYVIYDYISCLDCAYSTIHKINDNCEVSTIYRNFTYREYASCNHQTQVQKTTERVINIIKSI